MTAYTKARKRLVLKLLGAPVPPKQMTYNEFRNWDRLVREKPNR